MLQHRAEFDAAVTFEGGGDLRVTGFRLDVPHADVTEPDLATLFLARLGLTGTAPFGPDVQRAGEVRGDVTVSGVAAGGVGSSVEAVTFRGIRIFSEPVLVLDPEDAARTRFVELSHVIADGMTTTPGMPCPSITAHETWEQSSSRYAEGTSFSFDRLDMVGQTGTYIDTPRHRYEDGADLAGVPLERLAELPAVIVRSPRRVIDAADLENLTVAGHAVLIHTGHDRHFGTPDYFADAPYLTRAGAQLLVDRRAALVGIDSVNLDDFSPAAAGERPAHTLLLAAGIPIVENLTNLAELPPTGFRFTATPPRIAAFGTFPVRAFATTALTEDHDHTRSAGWQPR